MFGSKKKIMDRLDQQLVILKRLTGIIEEKNSVIKDYQKLAAELREQNKDLLNRLMSRNFQEHQTFKDQDYGMIGGIDLRDVPFDQDEASIGEIVEGKEG